ncbi:N-alpha-acetyltransferase 60, partial [Lucilia cuprina]|uniref:N-alpha-acetyltransferase 60 n=1 Tax=Lucilia cuprina TaxID=7375 RepID=UPI001F06842F
YNTTKSKYSNLPSSAEPIDIGRIDNDHVPLCSVNDVQLRFLVPDDLTEVRTLCQDWFPIDYPLSWYEDITSSSRFFSLAAVYNLAIIGLIVAEIKPYRNLNKEDKGILPDSMGKTADIGYILSLGVHRKHRRNGIGSLLLDALINHLTTAERQSVKAIFLHVLTTNQPAILFYEKRRFVCRQ